MKKMLFATIVMFSVISFFVALPGETLSYNFDLNNAGLSGGPWGTITLTQNGNFRVDFKVDPDANAFSGVDNFGLQTFGFNESTLDPTKLSLTGLSIIGWNWQYSEGSLGGFGPYGKFDFNLVGSGSSRQDPLEFSVIVSDDSFSISVSDFATQLSTAGYLFAGHIAGFEVPGSDITSAMFSTTGNAIPEPATMLLLGSGLIGLAGYGRKKLFKK
jgi:hypothetical protein